MQQAFFKTKICRIQNVSSWCVTGHSKGFKWVLLPWLVSGDSSGVPFSQLKMRQVMSFSKLLSSDWIYLNPLGGNSEGSGWWPEAHSDEQRNSSFPVFLFWDLRPAVWSQGNSLDLRNWKRSFSASLKAPRSLKNFYSISWWVTTIFPSLPNLKSQVWISIVRVRCQWRKSNRLLLRLELGHLTPCCKSDVFIIIIYNRYAYIFIIIYIYKYHYYVLLYNSAQNISHSHIHSKTCLVKLMTFQLEGSGGIWEVWAGFWGVSGTIRRFQRYSEGLS